MPVVVSILVAVAVALALVMASRLWFDRVQKRRHAERIGIDVLNSRRWRESLDLLVQALAADGLQQTAEVTSAGGAPMAERVLMRGQARILLIYKHGTTYRIGAPALRDAERRRQEAALDEVIIATLGSFDDEATAQAERMRIRCIDGAAVWAKVRDVLDATARDGVAHEAESLVDRPRRLATAGAAVLGLAIVFWSTDLERLASPQGEDAALAATATAAANADAPSTPDATPPDTAAASTRADTAEESAASAEAATTTPSVGSTTAPATTAPPVVDPRVAAAKAVAALPGIDRASWSSGSTLVVSLRPRVGIDAGVEQACALSAEHPVLREARLQVEAYGGGEVRWRRCG